MKSYIKNINHMIGINFVNIRDNKYDKAGDRYVNTLSALSEDSALGFGMAVSNDDQIVCNAFSVGMNEVLDKDWEWIFKECADVEQAMDDNIETLMNSSEKVYLISICDKVSDEMSDEADPDEEDYLVEYCNSVVKNDTYFKEFVGLMKESEAKLCFIFNASPRKNGYILLGTAGDITIRMKSALSMIMPDYKMTEISSYEDIDDKDANLSHSSMREMMCMFMFQIRNMQNAIAVRDNFDSISTMNLEKLESVHIDELGLGVRSYNCLMRNGIRTVAELCQLSYDELMGLRNMGAKSAAEIVDRLKELKLVDLSAKKDAPEDPLVEEVEEVDYFTKLDKLVGLQEVKTNVKEIAAFARLMEEMKKSGRECESMVLNMEFVGNPGTAKTTVARIIAGILHQIGLVKNDSVMEVGRVDLVGEYIGHTAKLVKQVFNQAKGGVLFIDEAYALAGRGERDFGKEAIATMVQEMENNREDTVVIFAGYPDEMERLFETNPGLRSRVPFKMHFRDYQADELLRIAELEASDRGFDLSDEAKDRLLDICGRVAVAENSGNGRYCRNLIETAILHYASRMYSGREKDAVDVVNDFILRAEDFAEVADLKVKRHTSMGFGAWQ